MDLIFNELSFSNKSENKQNAIDILLNFSETCSAAKQKGFKHVRTMFDFWNNFYFEDTNILNFLSNLPKTKSSFLRSYIRPPYIAEGNDQYDDKFIENKYLINNKDFNKQESVGLAYTSFFNTIAISLSTHKLWEKTEIEIFEISEHAQKKISVRHISIPSNLDFHKEWIENEKPVCLIETNIKPEEKRIKLSGTHHGNDKRLILAKKLNQSPYVVGTINSIDNSRKDGSNFIKECFPNGQIDIVLVETTDKYSIKIQTTGSTLKETEEIAKILKKKYE